MSVRNTVMVAAVQGKVSDQQSSLPRRGGYNEQNQMQEINSEHWRIYIPEAEICAGAEVHVVPY